MKINKERLNIVTVIPARGGSKSIPKKNIRILGGKPLLRYSIEYSLRCPLITRTVVSTDSAEIAEVARQAGAEVPFLRPSEYALDNTPDYPVMRHALDTLEKLTSEKIDFIVLLRPTSPLRPPGLIERGVELFLRFPQASAVRSVALCAQHPYRMWTIGGAFMTGYETGVPEPYNRPRQELPQVYYQTGDIEIICRKTLLTGSVSGEKILPLIIAAEDMVDIDNEDDFQKALKKLGSQL